MLYLLLVFLSLPDPICFVCHRQSYIIIHGYGWLVGWLAGWLVGGSDVHTHHIHQIMDGARCVIIGSTYTYVYILPVAACVVPHVTRFFFLSRRRYSSHK
jgi:hypothetical protein